MGGEGAKTDGERELARIESDPEGGEVAKTDGGRELSRDSRKMRRNQGAMGEGEGRGRGGKN